MSNKSKSIQKKTVNRVEKNINTMNVDTEKYSSLDSNFVQFLFSLPFEKTMIETTCKRFKLGADIGHKDRVIFWYIDDRQRVRSGIIMKYDKQKGKRVKQGSNNIIWFHSKIKNKPDNWTFSRCLFGLHQLSQRPETKSVNIVESEKTAIIMSLFQPHELWLATGGLSNLKYEMILSVKDKEIRLYCDKGCEAQWNDKMQEIKGLIPQIQYSIIDWHNNREEVMEGDDIADLYLNSMKNKVRESA